MNHIEYQPMTSVVGQKRHRFFLPSPLGEGQGVRCLLLNTKIPFNIPYFLLLTLFLVAMHLPATEEKGFANLTGCRNLLGYFRAEGNYDLDESQIKTLESIAYQHPWEGGMAVYDARYMLGLMVDDRTPTPQTIQNKSLTETNIEEKEKSDKYSVYPNPAKDELFVVYDGENQNNATLEIYNIIGKLETSINIKGKSKVNNISISFLESGIYFFRIIRNNEVVLKDKLVIIK